MIWEARHFSKGALHRQPRVQFHQLTFRPPSPFYDSHSPLKGEGRNEAL
jgi:hypothetical protein